MLTSVGPRDFFWLAPIAACFSAACYKASDPLLAGPPTFELNGLTPASTQRSLSSKTDSCAPIEGSKGAVGCEMKDSFIPALVARPAQKAGVIFQDDKLGAFFVRVTSDIPTISEALDRKYGKACQVADRGKLAVRRWCFEGGNLVLTNRGLPEQGSLSLIYLQDNVIPRSSPAEEIIDLIGDPIG